VNQPEGGTIYADPARGPAGTTVTLSNTPDAEYTFSRYTVDGIEITGHTVTLNSDVAVISVCMTGH
jgi:hypothetical protein